MSAARDAWMGVASKLEAVLRVHGVVIRLTTGRMVVQRVAGSNALYKWTWMEPQAISVSRVEQHSPPMCIEDVVCAVLDQCGARAVLAALGGLS